MPAALTFISQAESERSGQWEKLVSPECQMSFFINTGDWGSLRLNILQKKQLREQKNIIQ